MNLIIFSPYRFFANDFAADVKQQVDAAVVDVNAGDIPRPDVELLLLERVFVYGIVVAFLSPAARHLEGEQVERLEAPIEQDVEQADAFLIAELLLLDKVDNHIDLLPVLIGRHQDSLLVGQLFRQDELDTVEESRVPEDLGLLVDAVVQLGQVVQDRLCLDLVLEDTAIVHDVQRQIVGDQVDRPPFGAGLLSRRPRFGLCFLSNIVGILSLLRSLLFLGFFFGRRDFLRFRRLFVGLNGGLDRFFGLWRLGFLLLDRGADGGVAFSFFFSMLFLRHHPEGSASSARSRRHLGIGLRIVEIF